MTLCENSQPLLSRSIRRWNRSEYREPKSRSHRPARHQSSDASKAADADADADADAVQGVLPNREEDAKRGDRHSSNHHDHDAKTRSPSHFERGSYCCGCRCNHLHPQGTQCTISTTDVRGVHSGCCSCACTCACACTCRPLSQLIIHSQHNGSGLCSAAAVAEVKAMLGKVHS